MALRARILRVGTTFLAVPAVLALAAPARAVDIVVNDTSDTLHTTGCAVTGAGTCSLRDAITFANANPGQDSIRLYALYLQPTSALPAITDSVVLNGMGTSGIFPAGSSIDGSLAGSSDGLTIAADGCSISAISVAGFAGTGIVVLGNANLFPVAFGGFGTRIFAFLVHAYANNGEGFEIRGGTGNVLSAVSARTNGRNGIHVHAGAVGTAIAPAGSGSAMPFAHISGNGRSGIQIGDGASDTATRKTTIGHLGENHGNGGLPVDLAGDCTTTNDDLDVDSGPNGFQNFPLVSSAVFSSDGTMLLINGTMSSSANATYALRFYTQDAEFLGETSVTTDGAGFAPFGVSVARLGPANEPLGVLANATDAEGNTSEFASMPPGLPLPAAFHTVTPCRLVDTRTYASPLSSGIPQWLYLGECGVPATARAVVLNVTVTNPTGSGHVSLSGKAPLCSASTSTINFSAGQTRANNAVVTFDAGRALATATVAGSGTVDLILDVSGYFE